MSEVYLPSTLSRLLHSSLLFFVSSLFFFLCIHFQGTRERESRFVSLPFCLRPWLYLWPAPFLLQNCC
ncbi:hypothetical protein CSUI_004352 [Cystoisospora suis]|uniref:Transmembrane protein n=1 Tax=Cystoisospora suis TaxID=483139 RepID=A0A2C6L1U7_9APIC|nr:hypothetical protein CSUI_004352 [Cystoisospora suis]